LFPSSLISIKVITAKCHCIMYKNFKFSLAKYIICLYRSLRYIRLSMIDFGMIGIGIPSHTAGNENDEIRYRLRSRHASWEETIFRWIDEQFSVETECFKERYGNFLCWISSFKICSFLIQKILLSHETISNYSILDYKYILYSIYSIYI